MKSNKTKKRSKKTRKSIKRKNKKKEIDVVTIIALILIAFVVAGFMYGFIKKIILPKLHGENVYTFNGFKFYKVDKGVWHVSFTYKDYPYEAEFRYDPKSLLNINVPESVKIFSKLKNITLITDPDLESTYVIAMIEIAKILAKVFDVKINYGVTNENPRNVTIITCKDIEGIGIYFTKNNESNKVYWKKNCLIINTTDGWEAVKVADVIAYKNLGIMK